MKYAYSLFVLLGAYLLYHSECSKERMVFLSFLVLLGFLGMWVECCASKAWLNRYF